MEMELIRNVFGEEARTHIECVGGRVCGVLPIKHRSFLLVQMTGSSIERHLPALPLVEAGAAGTSCRQLFGEEQPPCILSVSIVNFSHPKSQLGIKSKRSSNGRDAGAALLPFIAPTA